MALVFCFNLVAQIKKKQTTSLVISKMKQNI